MDGVLFNSMPHHAQAWQQVMTAHGLQFTARDCYINEGRTGYDVIHTAAPDLSEQEVDAIYHEKGERFVQLGGAEVMNGVKDVLQMLKASGKDLWIVTGSGQLTLMEQLNIAFPNIFTREKMITAFECKIGKPNPEPYLMAWQRSGYAKQDCVVVENAPLGLRAAKAAGLDTIIVNTGPLLYEDFLSHYQPDLFLKNFEQLYSMLR